MNVIPIRRTVTVAMTLVTTAAAALGAQEATRAVTRLVAEPASVSVEAGQVAPIKVTAYDAEGLVVTEPRMRVSGTRGGVQITKDGVKGLRAGKYTVVVSTLPVDTTVKTVAITIPRSAIGHGGDVATTVCPSSRRSAAACSVAAAQ